MRYKLYLKAIPLKEALVLMESYMTVFYSYSPNEPVLALTEDCLSATIKNDAWYFKPDSMLMEVVECQKRD